MNVKYGSINLLCLFKVSTKFWISPRIYIHDKGGKYFPTLNKTGKQCFQNQPRDGGKQFASRLSYIPLPYGFELRWWHGSKKHRVVKKSI